MHTVKGDVDAVIWNVGGGKRTDHAGIRSDAAHRRSAILQATEAVILTRESMITQCNNCCVQLLINTPCLPINNEGQWGTEPSY